MQIIDGGSRRRDEFGVFEKDAGCARGDGRKLRGSDERKRRRRMEAGTEGETEMPETRVMRNGVEGIHVDLMVKAAMNGASEQFQKSK